MAHEACLSEDAEQTTPSSLETAEWIHSSAFEDELALLIEDEPARLLPTTPPVNTMEASGVAVVTSLTIDEFERRFRHRRPVLLRGFARHWSAITQWQSALLGSKQSMATCLKPRDGGRRFLGADCEKTERPVDEVAQLLVSSLDVAHRFYARAPLACLREHVDLSVIEALMGATKLKEHCCGVWFGPAENVTPFHYDLCHGFLAGVHGTKTFTLVEPDEWRSMYPRPERPELARIDLEAAFEDEHTDRGREERRRHPRFFGGDAPTLRRVVIEPGDVLYTPPYWWHHVETSADGPAVSVHVPCAPCLACTRSPRRHDSPQVLVPFDPELREPVHVCHQR